MPHRTLPVNLKKWSITKCYIPIFSNKTQSWCHQMCDCHSSSHMLGLEIKVTLGVCLLNCHHPLWDAEVPRQPCAYHPPDRPGFAQHQGLPSCMHASEHLFLNEASLPPLSSPVHLLILYANRDNFISFPICKPFVPFLSLLHWLGFPIWCWIKVVRGDTLALFSI